VSQIDGSLPFSLREVMMSEVRGLLPAFLSAAAREREGPLRAASELLQLAEVDMRRVLAVHAMLSTPIREFVAAVPMGMRRPLTESTRPKVAGRTVASAIDWAGTARVRATASPLGDMWVTRSARRIFDIPENQALAWLLHALEERAAVAIPNVLSVPGTWGREIRDLTGVVRRARKSAWLDGVSRTWPGDDVYAKLKADRLGFYQVRVCAAAKYLRNLQNSPSSDHIVAALSDRYFEPEQDWKLFEIAVLMRLTKALGKIGHRVGDTRLFGDTRGRSFATFRLSPSREVRLWYQTWPASTGQSELASAVRHYEIEGGGSRPDIVIEILDDGVAARALLLELKASSSAKYLASGLAQLLGYLRDRPALFSTEASAWLVAPAGSGYVSKPAAGRSLWMTDADAVAAAIVDAVRE
jgi:hypothetical protein